MLEWAPPLKATYDQVFNLHKQQWDGIWFPTPSREIRVFPRIGSPAQARMFAEVLLRSRFEALVRDLSDRERMRWHRGDA